MDKTSTLRGHILFKGLSDKNIQLLSNRFHLYRCDEGAVIYYVKDGADSLYLFIEGEFCSADGSNKIKRFYLPGDYSDPDKMLGLENHSDTLICRSPGKYLKISREDFVNFLNSASDISRQLEPLYSRKGNLIRGMDLKGVLSQDREGHGLSRRVWRRSVFFLFEQIFYPFVILLALMGLTSTTVSFPFDSLVYKFIAGSISLYAVVRWIFWLSERFILCESSISAIKISFRPLGVRRILLPLDQIRAIKVEKKQLKNRFFNVGSILIQTSAGTVLKLSDIDRPQIIQQLITDYINGSRKEIENRGRKEIRKKIEDYHQAEEKIHGFKETDDVVYSETDVVFRKSSFVLFAATWWQIASAASIITLIWLFRDSGGAVLVLPLLPLFLVFLWRFQDWRNDLYMVSGGKIIDINKKPFGKSESSNLADMSFVTNVRSEKKGILQYFFNYGDVLIETAGGSICFESVAGPLRVQEHLLQLREQWKKMEEEKKRDKQFQDFLLYSDIFKQAEEQKRLSRSTPPLAQEALNGANNI